MTRSSALGHTDERPAPSPQPVAPQRPPVSVDWRTRLLPRPLLALALWLTWLMLQHSLEPAHLLGGALLALVLSAWAGPPPRATDAGTASNRVPSASTPAPAPDPAPASVPAPASASESASAPTSGLGTAPAAAMAPSPSPVQHTPLFARLLITLRLIAVILKDIVVANLQVARLILGRQENLSPGFVTVPLRVRDPRAVSCLAAIVTMTPGTVSAELSDDRTWLYVHALDLRDAEALVTLIRERYEQPLLELMP